MGVTCSGVIRDPSNNPVPNLRITIRSVGTNPTSLDGSEIVVTTGSSGEYSFQLEEGRYNVFMDFGRETFVGEAVITATTGDDTLNQYLINVELSSVVSQALSDFERIRDETVTAASTTAQDAANAQAARVGAEAARDTTIAALDDAINPLNTITQALKEAERAQNIEKFAGSGWEHFGRHHDTGGLSATPINQGLWSRTSGSNVIPNTLFMGRNTSPFGDSKTLLPVMQMAGFTIHIEDLQFSSSGLHFTNYIKFDEAPTGAVTYDSATGTAFNFETQSDPKYGNVAADRNEAVARAFEFLVSNGDFRNGTVDFSTTAANVTVANSLASLVTTATSGRVQQELDTVDGTRYRIEVTMRKVGSGAVTGYLQLHSPFLDAGMDVELTEEFRTYTHETIAATSTSHNVYVGARQSGVTVEIASISVRPVTNQVVTRRVDMWGFEGFLEEVTMSNPFVYPNGLIQSQATAMNGITTVVGTRPASYYAVFDGDTGSIGRGVDFFAATVAQQQRMLGDPKNNLYRMDDGRLVQFRVRQRTINGAGDGDWQFINPFISASANFLYFSNVARPAVQGFSNTVEPMLGAVGVHTFGNLGASGISGSAINSNSHYVARSSTDRAVNGECYFLVGGTVSRLNQGAYHPELNSFGTNYFASSTNPTGRRNWHDSDAVAANSISDCFIDESAGGAQTNNNLSWAIGASIPSGQQVPRPDGRFYDAVYAGGLGGVVDYRWSANDRSDPKWGAKAKLEVEAGTYRGLELLQRTAVRNYTATSAIVSNTLTVPIPSEYTVGDTIYVQQQDNSYVERQVATVQSSFITVTENINRRTSGMIVHTFNLDVSVSGNFTRIDIIADPVRLLATFPTGVEGGWISQIPDNASPFDLTRKRVGSPSGVNLSAITTLNNGTSWSAADRAFVLGDNQQSTVLPSDRVQVTTYHANAAQTVRSTNTEVLNAQNGQYGVNALSFFGETTGALLAESFLGKVLTDSSPGRGLNQHYPFTLLNLRPDNGLIDALSGRESEHPALQLFVGSGTGTGVKYGTHQVNDNGQATLNFIFNEIEHDGTDWGDDSRLRVLNGTYTNQNGVSGLQANVDRLAIAYGIIKNEV